MLEQHQCVSNLRCRFVTTQKGEETHVIEIENKRRSQRRSCDCVKFTSDYAFYTHYRFE